MSLEAAEQQPFPFAAFDLNGVALNELSPRPARSPRTGEPFTQMKLEQHMHFSLFPRTLIIRFRTQLIPSVVGRVSKLDIPSILLSNILYK